MSIELLHTGDSHVDVGTHGILNPKTGFSTAWESNTLALASAVQEAIDRDVAAFLHCGDAFKDGRPSQEALLMFAEALRPLIAACIPIVMVDGNHERISVPTSHRTATAAVGAILDGSGGEIHVVDREPRLVRTGTGLQVACLPWLSKSTVLATLGIEQADPQHGDRVVAQYAVECLEAMAAEADTTAPFVIASHVTVDDVRVDSVAKGQRRGSEMDIAHLFAEPILPRAAIEETGASYAALSHIHARQRIGKVCYYAGSPNRLTFTDADDDKSANLVTLGDDNTLESVTYLPTEARAMHSIALADDDAEDRIGALTNGALVRVVLPPGVALVPESVRTDILTAGALLVDTQVTPLDRPRITTTALPEKIDPAAAFEAWLAERHPDLDSTPVMTAAAKLLEVAK